MPSWAKVAVDQWTAAAGIAKGKLFRAVQGDRVTGQGITPQTVFLVVERLAKGMAVPFRPHDLRRTFAKLAYAGGSPLEQIPQRDSPRFVLVSPARTVRTICAKSSPGLNVLLSD
jgi:integrase